MESLDEDIAFQSNIPVPMDTTLAVIYFVFGVCSLFGNSTLLFVSYKKKHLLKPAEYFIINLAVSDLGLTLSLYPMAITSSFHHRWLYGKTACSIYAFCGMLFGLCSLTTLTLLSMVCFMKVCHPLYGNRFNSFHVRRLIAFAWVYALLFASSPLAYWGEYGPEPYGTACCIDWRLSNQHSTARSYTVALFLFCYIIPCCVILASYTGILVTVHASHKSMERHAMRQTHISSNQTIIVKLSVAVCISFLAAWSPYALVSMWAAFGHIENIPPLAFALPAMFAKSSTIYNPIIYLMLRPTVRRMVRSNLATLCHACLKGCLCSQEPPACCSKPEIRVRLCSIHRQINHFPSSNSSAKPPIVAFRDHSCEKCQDAFDCYTHYPRICSITNAAANGDSSKDQDTPVSKTHVQKTQRICRKKSQLAIICAKRTSEIDNFHIDLEMVPGHAKVAWP
ncbi:opsin 7, group member a [Etheostoma cragini]|uniref:opsin 7, group member a n=1 Tax=Etheostoma cragini TaxID=417921 RepID=UPI00155EF604|nr:opsin 7, group member a [Etheostoma cragini]